MSERVKVALRWGLASLFLLACGYLLFKNVQISGSPGYDFKSFWLAGEVWSRGLSAYGAEYFAIGKQTIPGDYVPDSWFYPPNLWPVVVAQAATPLAVADMIWRAVNTGLVLTSSVMLFRFLPDQIAKRLPLRGLFRQSPVLGSFLLFFFWFAIFQAMALCLVVGQIAFLLLFGLVLLLAGISRQAFWLKVLGLAILCLKPQIGAGVALALFLFDFSNWRIVFAAGLVSIVAALPTLASDPYVIVSWLTNVSGPHGEHPANVRGSITGIRNLLWLVTDFEISNMGAQVISLVAVAIFAVLQRLLRPETELYEVVIVQVLLITALAPLHYYDYVIIAPAVVLVMARRGVSLWLALAAIIFLLRSNDVAEIFGLVPAETVILKGSWLATYGAVVLFAALAYNLLAKRLIAGPTAQVAT